MLELFKNNEARRLALVFVLIILPLTAVGCFISLPAGLLILVAGVLCAAAALVFERWKYRQLRELSGYLKRICAGEYNLDVRDHQEGELSILKSEIYKVTTMLSEYNEQLRREKIQLSDAISDISHQLKTPLTSMMVMVDLLSDDTLPPDKRREFTREIQNQLERIQWLVSSLLRFSKLDAGTVTMRKQRVNIRPLVEKAMAPLQIPMELKEQTCTLQGSDDAGFYGDDSWSAEALLNILKNCVEHTPKGGQLHVCWEENALLTRITVSDNGEGIEKEDLPHIFTRFYRGKNASSDSVGIGLAMAKRIVVAQGGDITVDSRKGEGTTFTIQFYKAVV